MSDSKMFSKLVFYLESCESGSMFEGMNIPNVYALSAANPKESSWGAYCGSAAKVNGKNVGSCLGDLFSVSWMEDSDKGALATETLKEQIARVTQLTNKSHVEAFGDKSFESEPLGNFETALQRRGGEADSIESNDVDVRDLPLKQAYWKWEHADTKADKDAAAMALEEIVVGRMKDLTIFD